MFFLFLIIISVIYLKENNTTPKESITKRRLDISETSDVDLSIIEIVKKINIKNNLIKNFFCNKLEVKIWENIHKLKLYGSLNYQKPFGFRLELNSFFGKELDLGSNDKIFWYWSKRDRRPGVYWAYYEDFYKTRLKNPFNPMFMRATFGIENIDLKDSIFSQNNVDFMLTQKRKNSNNETIFFSIIINKYREQVDGFIISDANGVSLATCEIQKRNNDDIPSKILYKWNEEKKTMMIDLSDCFINQNLNQSAFKIPDIDSKINMANE